MLTKKPKVAEHVLIVYSTLATPKFLPVTKVGAKYLWVDDCKFNFDGSGASGNTGYELFDNYDAYDRHKKRVRNIQEIKYKVLIYGFGNELSDETLEQILRLIEGKTND